MTFGLSPFLRLVSGDGFGLSACPLIQMTWPTADHTWGILLQNIPGLTPPGQATISLEIESGCSEEKIRSIRLSSALARLIWANRPKELNIFIEVCLIYFQMLHAESFKWNENTEFQRKNWRKILNISYLLSINKISPFYPTHPL